MGRRKHKITGGYRPVKVLPTAFDCPACGQHEMHVKMNRAGNSATIKCGSCMVEEKFDISSIDEPVDVYGYFIDKFYD